MKYSIVYSSRTGNTALLARTLRDVLPEENIVSFGAPNEVHTEADMIFAGFWTDRGSCCPEMQEFLRGLEHKTVALFATAGFGEDAAYFERILSNVASLIPKSCKILPGFACQGKMPEAGRSRYEAQLAANPDDQKAAMFLKNFEKALAHPNEDDLKRLKAWAAEITRPDGK